MVTPNLHSVRPLFAVGFDRVDMHGFDLTGANINTCELCALPPRYDTATRTKLCTSPKPLSE
jgi:hypothetical protein